MDVFITKAHFSVDSTGASSSYLENKDLLSMSMSVDSLNVKYQEAISTNISKLAIQAKTSPVIDTTAVIPMTGQIRFDYLRTRLPDSVLLVAGRTVLKGGIKSSDSDKRIPTVGATISVDTLRYFSIPMRTGMILSENTFNLQALPYRDAMRQRRLARTDTTRINTTRRVRRPRTADNPSQIDSTDVTTQLLRQWEVRGSLSFKQMRGFSRMMPIPIKIDQTTMKFNTNDITLTDARLHLGKSNFVLNGEINKIRQAMLPGAAS